MKWRGKYFITHYPQGQIQPKNMGGGGGVDLNKFYRTPVGKRVPGFQSHKRLGRKCGSKGDKQGWRGGLSPTLPLPGSTLDPMGVALAPMVHPVYNLPGDALQLKSGNATNNAYKNIGCQGNRLPK